MSGLSQTTTLPFTDNVQFASTLLSDYQKESMLTMRLPLRYEAAPHNDACSYKTVIFSHAPLVADHLNWQSAINKEPEVSIIQPK